ncbi:aldo/keto reductase [Chloroflexota bacterium]
MVSIKYRRLGNSALKVSEIRVGCVNFATRTDEETSINIINHALEMGINFIDTADLYAQGQPDEFVGQAVTVTPDSAVRIYLDATDEMAKDAEFCKTAGERSLNGYR